MPFEIKVIAEPGSADLYGSEECGAKEEGRAVSVEPQIPDSLRASADNLIAAAYAYWRELGAVAGSRAVLWLEDTAGRVVIFTRGEYRQHLMENIERRGLELHFTELPEKGPGDDPR